MRVVTKVRIGHFSYDSPGTGDYDVDADVWRYDIALQLEPLIDRGDGVAAQPDTEEIAAIVRMVGDLSHVGRLELPAGANGAEPSTPDVLGAVHAWIATRQGAARAAEGLEIVPAYLRDQQAE